MMDQSRFLPPGQAEPLPLHAETATLQPRDPRVAFDSQAVRKLDDHEWTSLSNDLYQSVLTSLTARGALEQNLKDWSDMYDQLTGQKDWPFANSSNLSLPYISSQLDSLVAYIVGQVLVPRLYM